MTDLLERLSSALADRYTIEREIGRGGMATVVLAEDLKHHRKVAIKVLHPELAAAVGGQRFLQEIETVASLNHPHILMLFDSGEADGLLYFVMPYAEGESLRRRLDREKQLPVDETVRIAVEVADGLDYAHRHGVVHRDIKPGNILLSEQHALIADFGIARAIEAAREERITSTGLGVGTPLYASPEQATGEETLDGRTDIYSLACVLYEMLAGEPPLIGTTPQMIQARRLSETPTALHSLRDTVPVALDAVIARALARVPADRYATAAQFGQALQAVQVASTPVAGDGLAATPVHGFPGPKVTSAEESGQRPRRWMLGAAVVAATVIGAWLVSQRAGVTGDGGDDPAESASERSPVETVLELEGRFGEQLWWGTGSFAISPDGTQFAYCSRDTADERIDRLWIADLTVPNRPHRVLSSGSGCSWVRWLSSGDGVLFYGRILGRLDYYLAARDGSSVRPLTGCSPADSAGNVLFEPRKSMPAPDGSHVVYYTTQDDFFRVVPTGTCDFSRGDSIPVTGDFMGIWVYTWSPDGDRLLLETEEAGGAVTLWTIGSDGRDQQYVTQRGTHFHPGWWSSAGKALYLGDEARSGFRVVRIMLSNTGEPKGVLEPLAYFDEHPIRWFSISENAHKALVARRTDLFRIVRVKPDTPRGRMAASIVPVTETTPGYGAFSGSHDGQWIAFAKKTVEGADLYRVPVEGGEPERLTDSGLVDGGEWPAWSPDDQLIAYSGVWLDTLRLWLVAADGSSTGRVTDVITHYERPALSWEGADLHYRRHDKQLERLENLQLEYGRWLGTEWHPAPTGAPPSGSFIMKAERSELMAKPLRHTTFYPVVASPDGSRIVTGCSPTRTHDYWCLHSSADLSSELLMAATDDEHPLGWTDDGRSLYWQSGDDIHLWDVDRKKKAPLLTLPAGVRWIRYDLASGADCEPRRGIEDVEFLCAIDESHTNLFLLENFDPEFH